MFQVNDIVLLNGFVFDPDVLAENENKFKIVSVTPGTFTSEEGFQFDARGVVNGERQIFSTITIESRGANVVKLKNEDVVDVKIIYPPGAIKAGTKVKPDATGGNLDFIKGKAYEVEEVVDDSGGLYLVTIYDESGHLCYCLIGDCSCPHAGGWQVIEEDKEERQLRGFVKGKKYQLSGSVFCDEALEANNSIFIYNGFDIDRSHEFIGPIDEGKQWVTVRSIRDSDRTWASVKPV